MKEQLLRMGMAFAVVAIFSIPAIAFAADAQTAPAPAKEKPAEPAADQPSAQSSDKDAEFEKNADTKGYMPYGKSELEYEIKVPKDWDSDEEFGAKAPLEENTKQ